ncbi:xanthine dehydrogenase family protein molybdopterin-binding subunit [Intrasporangium sp.]|uniref:xanthine dehydrogenase family protein molybdopterin-binding subunit n=1 Tax=Intrasporangium sp. TaxID=1925024 RepID=UPI0032214F26
MSISAIPGEQVGGDRPYVGTPVSRVEDERLLAGRGRFLADLAAGALAVAFLRSTEAHAVIESIDTTPAMRMPGVLGVFTGDDLQLANDHIGSLHTPHPAFVAATGFRMVQQRLAIMPVDRVHYVGQPVVAVLASDRYLAEDALETVEVTYRPRPPLLDPESALAPDAAPMHPGLPDNEAAAIEVDFGDDLDPATVAVVTEGTYRIGRHGAVPLEGRGVLARIDGDRVSVWTSTQIPHLVRQGICDATGWSVDDVRVSVPDVGGGFGTKANVYAEEIIVPVLARRTGHDLVWVEDRQEHLTGSAQGRDQVHRTRLSVAADGRILRWEDDFLMDIGAGGLWVAGVVANTAIHLLGPYRIPRARLHGRAAFTNKTITAQYRGAGRPEACFALERSLDEAARQLGLTPIQIRERNLLTRADLPYSQPLPQRDGVPIVYDGGDYLACLQAAVELLPPESTAAHAARHPELSIGHGVGCYIEATGRGSYESARVRLTPSGGFEVATGAASAGQAHETVFAQVTADVLGAPLDRITVRRTDTDLVRHGFGSFASRSAVLAGSAVRRAADEFMSQATDRAARLLGVPAELVKSTVTGFATAVGASLRDVTWTDLAAACRPGGAQEQLGPLDVVEYFHPRTVTWTMGAHAAVVGVHRGTGAVSVLDYAVAHEGGVEINPLVVEGQIIGGVAQGIGGALLEEYRFSPEGQPTCTTLAEYLLPGTCDVPDVRIRHLAVPTTNNPLGVRGAGESGTIAVSAAVAGAVDDALAGRVHVSRTPISTALLRAALDTEGGTDQ